ncbi:MAG: hypothetical protein HYZ42_15910, partial [Bacteroidetes bacterium]|nr:hypothetical protein [Bacteroidota bacterium]
MYSTLFHSSFVTIVCICSSIIAFGQKEFLVTIEPISGSFTVIDSLPDVHLIQTMPAYTTYDNNNHRFIFKGVDFDANNRLYTIDAPTGDILTNPLFPQLTDISDNIIETQFDSELNTLYGLHWDNSDQQEYLVSIDLTSGIHTIISGLPGVHAIAVGITTYDENNHHYIFHGIDNSGYHHLYTVDGRVGLGC